MLPGISFSIFIIVEKHRLEIDYNKDEDNKLERIKNNVNKNYKE